MSATACAVTTTRATYSSSRGPSRRGAAEHTGAVRLTGDARLLEPFTAIFRLD